MSDYIEREAFIAEQRHLYCDNCARRKNSKGKLVYDIGDAPCRACGICDVLDAVEDAPAADVWPVVRGKWNAEMDQRYGVDNWRFYCSKCGFVEVHAYFDWKRHNYCPNCGADMKEES